MILYSLTFLLLLSAFYPAPQPLFRGWLRPCGPLRRVEAHRRARHARQLRPQQLGDMPQLSRRDNRRAPLQLHQVRIYIYIYIYIYIWVRVNPEEQASSLALSCAPVCGMRRLPEGSRRDTGGVSVVDCKIPRKENSPIFEFIRALRVNPLGSLPQPTRRDHRRAPLQLHQVCVVDCKIPRKEKSPIF